jgi:hypothetical protein
VVGYPEELDLTGGVLDTEEDGQPGQGDRVEGEQVAGQDPVRRGAEKLRPGSPRPSRRRLDSRRGEDLPDGQGADVVAEVGEFSVDAAVSPGGILGGQARHQRA